MCFRQKKKHNNQTKPAYSRHFVCVAWVNKGYVEPENTAIVLDLIKMLRPKQLNTLKFIYFRRMEAELCFICAVKIGRGDRSEIGAQAKMDKLVSVQKTVDHSR